VVGLMITTISSYLAWLGWHTLDNFDGQGEVIATSYAGWRVCGLVVTLMGSIVLAVLASLRPRAAVNTTGGALLAVYWVDASTTATAGGNFFLVGILMFAPTIWGSAWVLADTYEQSRWAPRVDSFGKGTRASSGAGTGTPAPRSVESDIAAWRSYRDRVIGPVVPGGRDTTNPARR
jgi:hypothetical protein